MNPHGIADRITGPHNCILGLGIPTSEEGLRRAREEGAATCFAHRFRDRPSTYWPQVIAPYKRLEVQMRRCGARLVPDLTLSRYASLFWESDVHAVILFSHWDGDRIEFRDGMAGVDEVIQAIPEGCAVIVDLCVCHPEKLLPRLSAARSEVIIRSIAASATPLLWLHFYRDLFRLLQAGQTSYLGASIALLETYFRLRPVVS